MGWKHRYYKEKCRSLVFSSKEIELEANADNTTYMVMTPDQSTGQYHNIRTDNKSFEKVEQFKHLGTSLMNQNSIQEDNQSTLLSGKACCHAVQNFLFSSLLSKHLKILRYTELQFYLMCMGVKLGRWH